MSSSDEVYDDDNLDSDSEEEIQQPVEDSESIEPQTEVPKDIELSAVIVGISCHPKRNIVAAGTIAGPVHLHTFDVKEGNREIVVYEHHKKPCRAVRFSETGEHLFTASQDAKVCAVDLETNSVCRKFFRENGSPLYSILPIDSNIVASGEDDGQVVLWDFRVQAPVQCFEDCEDYISSLSVNADKRTLVATSGDGTLSAYSVRGRKLESRSEELDSDLVCSGIFKNGTKLAVGAGDGSINIFNWGEFGNISDRFPGHPGSVDSMAVLSDDIIFTGCEDGKVRAVQLFPTRFLGVLGSHHGFSVESLSVAHESKLLASSSYDQKIKFWDLSGVDDAKLEDVRETKEKQKQLNRQVDDFFADLA